MADLLSPRENQLVALIASIDGPADFQKVSIKAQDQMGISASNVGALLHKLKEKGVVETTGTRRNYEYHLRSVATSARAPLAKPGLALTSSVKAAKPKAQPKQKAEPKPKAVTEPAVIHQEPVAQAEPLGVHVLHNPDDVQQLIVQLIDRVENLMATVNTLKEENARLKTPSQLSVFTPNVQDGLRRIGVHVALAPELTLR